MINLLPPELKDQVKFSKHNILLLRLLILIVGLSLLLAATLYTAHVFADRQIEEYSQSLARSQQQLNSYQDLETNVSSLNNRLNTIDQLMSQQTRFSALLEDLADTLPPDAYINSIVLTGQDDQPVRITVTTRSFNQASLLQEALSSSARIESVDTQSISAGSNGYNVEVVMKFSEGAAR